MKNQVACYSGGSYAEKPRTVIWEGQRETVDQIIQRRRTPEGLGFLVKCASGQIFDLVYLTREDCWRVQPR